MYIYKYTSLLTGGSSTKKHRPVPGRASADLLRDFRKFLVLFRHRTMPGRAPYGARTVAVQIVQFKCLTKIGRQGTARCPADVILPLMTLQNAVFTYLIRKQCTYPTFIIISFRRIRRNATFYSGLDGSVVVCFKKGNHDILE